MVKTQLQTKNRSRTHKLIRLAQQFKDNFSNKKYLEIIYESKRNQELFDAHLLDYFYFDCKVTCIMYLGLSYFKLCDYKNAFISFSEIEDKYDKLYLERGYWKKNIKFSIDEEQYKKVQTVIYLISNQLNAFYKNNRALCFSNLAYSLFKLKKYKLAIVYFKKALKINNKNIQLNLGIAEAQYYDYRSKLEFKIFKRFFKDKIPKEIKNNYNKTINMLKKLETSFDTLLALGKMYYFLEEYDTSFSYLQRALEYDKSDYENKKIYAFDWLSRIAFKKKFHHVAVGYYEEIIKTLIEVPIEKENEIHPRPELNKMFEYLTINKNNVIKQEIHYINKSIWGGILAGIVLESAEIYAGHSDISVLWIIFIMVLLVLIISFTFINIYK